MRKKKMKITYFGHSCFKIEENGYSLVIDPFRDVRGYKNVHTTADMILCSHDHFDHAAVEGVKRKVSGAQNPFGITMMQTYHDEKSGAERGENLVHIIMCDGKKIVHLGDLGHELNAKQLEYVKNCDALMIPVGGHYTIDADTAWRVINAVDPKIAIPMHYRNGKYGFEVLSQLSEFMTASDRKIAVATADSFELPQTNERLLLVPAVCEK